jgi:hypothetical protein
MVLLRGPRVLATRCDDLLEARTILPRRLACHARGVRRGAGLFGRIDVSDRVARPLVQSVLRSAQNWAVSRGAPALVRIDHARGTLRAEGQLVVGTWHFETLPVVGSYVCLGAAEAAVRIIADGFTLGTVTPPGPPAGWKVALQDPPAGSTAVLNAPVSITLEDPALLPGCTP